MAFEVTTTNLRRRRYKLSDVLHKLDAPSPRKLVRDHEGGKLDWICRDEAA